MKYFTICTDDGDWPQLCTETVARLKSLGGVDCETLIARDIHHAHKAKLAKFLEYDEPVAFVDCDWWLVRQTTMPDYVPGGILAAPNESGMHRYWETDVNQSHVFCSCFVMLDMQTVSIRNVVEQALRLQRAFYYKGSPRSDEMFLNIAAQSLDVPITLLSNHWNWCAPPTEEVIAIHAAGQKEKLQWLKQHANV